MKILIVGASGYVGARLAHDLMHQGHELLGCDLSPPIADCHFSYFYQGDYVDIPETILANCDVVLWFAGHSTVKISQNDPIGAFKNNAFKLTELGQRLTEKNIPLIYASSASLLSTDSDSFSIVSDERRSNPYDASKLVFDLTVNSLPLKAIGLRMATVAGWSPVMRWDTLFNGLNKTAHTEKLLRVSNPSNFRGILYIEHLSKYINYLIKNIQNGQFEAPKQVPLASWAGSIGTIASEISKVWDVPIVFGQDSGTYSFVINDIELRRVLTREEFYKSINEHCKTFCQQLGW